MDVVQNTEYVPYFYLANVRLSKIIQQFSLSINRPPIEHHNNSANAQRKKAYQILFLHKCKCKCRGL